MSLLCLLMCKVFDEHVRRSKAGGGNTREMDFESFLDFVLALENKDTPDGLTYLFKCLDLQGRGYLSTADIHTLFRCVFNLLLWLLVVHSSLGVIFFLSSRSWIMHGSSLFWVQMSHIYIPYINFTFEI